MLLIISSYPDEDTLWVKKAGRGDIEAFELLVRKYEKRVYGMALRILADREDARDASQETFLKAFRSLAGFRGASKFSTWLYRVASNVCVDSLRRRDAGIMSIDGAPGQDGPETVEIPSDFDVEAAAESGELTELVRRAVDMLPDAHRAIVVMRDMHALEYGEIAEILGIAEGTVKSRLNRARRRLREIILGLRELKDYTGV